MNTLSSTLSPMARFPAMARFSPPLLVVALLAACDGDPPVPCPGHSMPQVDMVVGETSFLEPCFDDPDNERLTITAGASDPEVVSTLVLAMRSHGRDIVQVRLEGLSPGSATVTITAEDPDGQTASTEVAVVVLPRLIFREDFDADSGGFVPAGAELSLRDGKLELASSYAGKWGWARKWLGVRVAEWEVTASLGKGTDNDGKTAPGFMSYFGGTNPIYVGMNYGHSAAVAKHLGAGDDHNFALVYFNYADWWTTDDDLWGRSDACERGLGELLEVAWANRAGELTARCGGTVVIRMNRLDEGWSHMDIDHLSLSVLGLKAYSWVMFDWVEMTGVPLDEAAQVAWDEGPLEVPEDVFTLKRGVDIPR